MYRLLIILTLTFIQGHTDEDNKSSILSETIQEIPITFAVKIVRLKVYIIILFSARWPCSSLKVTTASLSWWMLNSYHKQKLNIFYLNLTLKTFTWPEHLFSSLSEFVKAYIFLRICQGTIFRLISEHRIFDANLRSLVFPSGGDPELGTADTEIKNPAGWNPGPSQVPSF